MPHEQAGKYAEDAKKEEAYTSIQMQTTTPISKDKHAAIQGREPVHVIGVKSISIGEPTSATTGNTLSCENQENIHRTNGSKSTAKTASSDKLQSFRLQLNPGGQRPAGTQTVEEYQGERKQSAREYVKATFFAHFCIMIIAIGFEALFIKLCVDVSEISPYATVFHAADTVLSAQENVTLSCHDTIAQSSTLCATSQQQLSVAAASFVSTVAESKQNTGQLFIYESTFTGACLFAVWATAASVYANRNHAVVRSRGRLYLVLLFVLGTLNVSNALFFGSAYFFVFNQFPLDKDYTQPGVVDFEIEKTANLIFSGFTIGILLISAFFTTLALRQRMIAHVFHARATDEFMSTTKLLKWGALWTFVGFFLSEISYVVWRFKDTNHPRGTRYGVSGLMGIGLVYIPLIFFYIFHARSVSIKFNDFYSNFRASFVMTLGYLILMTFNLWKPDHIVSACIGWSSLVRFAVVVQIMDQFCTQALQAWWEIPAMPEAGISTTMRNMFVWRGVMARPDRGEGKQAETGGPKLRPIKRQEWDSKEHGTLGLTMAHEDKVDPDELQLETGTSSASNRIRTHNRTAV